jgi:hypothetical protein
LVTRSLVISRTTAAAVIITVLWMALETAISGGGHRFGL